MAERTGIAWTDSSWNPVRGCERVSDGCKKCYAEELAARHSYKGGWGEGLAKWVTRPDGTREARWTGVIQTLDRMLDAPLKWREPRRIFVNSMSDLFHKDVSAEFVARVFGVMAVAQRHVFQILTKRPERMLELLMLPEMKQKIANTILDAPGDWHWPSWPLPNVWLGVSVENQDEADKRIPLLQQTPAAVHWLSCEPLLDHIEIGEAAAPHPGIRWVVVGGESGGDPRPMQMEHARALIEQCKSAGVATFVKQDNGPRPGLQGRFTDEEWALKEYPA